MEMQREKEVENEIERQMERLQRQRARSSIPMQTWHACPRSRTSPSAHVPLACRGSMHAACVYLFVCVCVFVCLCVQSLCQKVLDLYLISLNFTAFATRMNRWLIKEVSLMESLLLRLSRMQTTH
jgi:hypothetical protein